MQWTQVKITQVKACSNFTQLKKKRNLIITAGDNRKCLKKIVRGIKQDAWIEGTQGLNQILYALKNSYLKIPRNPFEMTKLM